MGPEDKVPEYEIELPPEDENEEDLNINPDVEDYQ